MAAHPDSPGLAYNLACLEALQGRGAEALAHLRAALEHDPELAAAARDDEDFASLREDDEFRKLTARA
jgi:thioredoxin-like negative regulator of GroEL